MNAAVIIETRGFDMHPIILRHGKYLPSDWQIIHKKPTKINNLSDYNAIMTSVDFWKSLLHYNRVLIFQHDSGLLRNGIEEFLEYDYVGAPWTFQLKGGNGGLSLRNPAIMIKTIETIQYNEATHGNEDVYFSNHIERIGGKLAPRDVCFRFSCETIYREGTLGYHAIEKYLPTELVNKILNQYDR
jgi:hypothetical protein